MAREWTAVDCIFPGVADGRGQGLRLATAAEAAEAAVDQAAAAASSGTYGVGAVLLGPELEVVAWSQNRVVREGRVCDPTAHAERQLVDWFFQNRPAGPLTIVSALDPCLMCTGSILAAGMRVVTVALDNLAGINYGADGLFSALPQPWREQARLSFGYFGVQGRRVYQGASSIPFAGQAIAAHLEDRAIQAFRGTLHRVQQHIYGEPESLSGPRAPGPELASSLLQAAQRAQAAGHQFDAAALVDPRGRVLLAVGGQEACSPLRTPFVELTRAYVRLRQHDPRLPHMKVCRVVTLLGPGARPEDVMQLGAYGSSIEGALPTGSARHWQYVLPRQPQAQLETLLAGLPPLYSQTIGVDIQPLGDHDLVAQVEQVMPQRPE